MVLAKRVGKRVVTMVLSMSYFKCFLVCCFCLYPRVVGNELRSLYSSPKISGRKIKSQAFFPLYTTEKDWSCDRVYVHLLLSKSKMHNGIFYILKKIIIQIELIWNADEEWEKQSQGSIYPGLCLFFHYLADLSLILICPWARNMQFWQSSASSM